MKAMAIKAFKASMSGRFMSCAAGEVFEADAKTIGQLEAMGLATTKIKRKPTRKAAEND